MEESSSPSSGRQIQGSDDGDNNNANNDAAGTAPSATAAASSAVPSNSSASASLSLQDQMDHVLNLLQQPVPNTRHVDEAVSTVLETLQFNNTSTGTTTTTAKAKGERTTTPAHDDDDEGVKVTTNKKKRSPPRPSEEQGSSQDQDNDKEDESNKRRKMLIVNNVMGDKMTDSLPMPASAAAAATSAAAAAGAASHSQGSNINNNMIRVDMGNYDDEEEEEEVTKTKPDDTKNSTPAALPPASGTTTAAAASTAPTPSSKSVSQSKKDKKQEEKNRLERISNIPMGAEAAKMMVTFGDGRQPRSETIELALLATRLTMQLAIMDARVVRRRLQTEYVSARLSLNQYVNPKIKRQHRKSTEGTTAAATVTATGSFRALADGPDRLALTAKCGFDMEELTHLFPEEMRSYQRWTEMKDDAKEVTEAEADDKTPASDIDDDDDDDEEEGKEDDSTTSSPRKKKKKKKKKDDQINDDDSNNNNEDENEPTGGHLKQRLVQFDVRTDQMTTDWYSKFAKVRQGSFLKGNVSSQNYRQRLDQEHEWEELRNTSSKGRKAKGTWETIPAKSVRFLHWLGFDPPNLCPPDDEVTGALAFLAYDRLGRIVEKAIYLRNMDAIEQLNNDDADDAGGLSPQRRQQLPHNLWEIPPGQQLSKEDIERALEDPDVKPSGIYSSFSKEHHATSKLDFAGAATAADDDDAKDMDDIGNGPLSGPSSIQLYFGEGFEDRLELEMEEMIAATTNDGTNGLSEEELKIRKEEAELLAKISAPPNGDGLYQVIEQNRSKLKQKRQDKELKKEQEMKEMMEKHEAAEAAETVETKSRESDLEKKDNDDDDEDDEKKDDDLAPENDNKQQPGGGEKKDETSQPSSTNNSSPSTEQQPTPQKDTPCNVEEGTTSATTTAAASGEEKKSESTETT